MASGSPLNSRLTLLMDGLLRFQAFLQFTSGIILTIYFVVASWLADRPLRGHHLKIGRISINKLSLYDVHYTGALYDEYTYTLTAPRIFVRLHLPTPSYPSWLVLTAHELLYKSTTCDTSLTRMDVTFWLFPYLFKRTAGPWISAELDGSRLRVHHSNETPYWIKRLRQNLVGALLNGDIYRLDDVKATVQFAGVSETQAQIPVKCKRQPRVRALSATLLEKSNRNGHDRADGDEAESSEEELDDSDASPEESSDEYEADGSSPADHVDPPAPFLNRDTDELRATVSACQLHLHNSDDRIYTFRAVDAQLRRDWDTDRGSFVLVAEEGRWVRVHRPYQREWTPWWTQVFTSLGQFPFDLMRFINFPMSAVDVYIIRADVVFDQFRLRDAELITQGLVILREKTALFGVNWGDAIFDAFVKAVIMP